MGGKHTGWGAARLVPRQNEQGRGHDGTTTRWDDHQMGRPPDGTTTRWDDHQMGRPVMRRAQVAVACWGGELRRGCDAALLVPRHNEQGVVMV